MSDDNLRHTGPCTDAAKLVGELRERVADAIEHADPGVSIDFELAQRISDALESRPEPNDAALREIPDGELYAIYKRECEIYGALPVDKQTRAWVPIIRTIRECTAAALCIPAETDEEMAGNGMGLR